MSDSPLIVSSKNPKSISFGQVLVQILRTGRRGKDDKEDGFYASLLFFIWLSSFAAVVIFTSMTKLHHLYYTIRLIFTIIYIIFVIMVLLKFLKSKRRWIETILDCPQSNSSNNQREDASENQNGSSETKNQKSSLSLIGIYIFGSITLVMFTIDMVEVGTCIPFFFYEFNTRKHVTDDILYLLLRGFYNIFFCSQIVFFVYFKNTKFTSSPWFCYSFLLFVSANFIAILEGLVYIGAVRLAVTRPWQNRDGLKMNTSGDYDVGCYNSNRLFDKSVYVMQDICYPFAIEFYILSIGIFLHHWFSLVPSESKSTTNGEHHYQDELDSGRTDHHHQERHCSFPMLFSVFVSLLLITSAAMLLLQSTEVVIIYIYHTFRLVYQVLLIIPVMFGVRYLSHFRYDRRQALDGSEKLLFSTVTATFLVTTFTTITSATLLHKLNSSSPDIRIVDNDNNTVFNATVTDSALCFSYSIVNHVQIIMQTCFFVSARRRVPSLRSSVVSYRLCDCFLYLAVCNAFILATDTFIALHAVLVDSPTNVWFFGELNWNIIESILFPVAELYHFHSVLLCSELYLAFRPK